MAQKRSTQHNRISEDTPAAEHVIDGQLAWPDVGSHLRQISPLTAGLVVAVTLALGLSVWPYIAPYLITQSDDPWQLSVEQDLSALRAEVAMLSDQQDKLAVRLDAVQTDLTGLDQTMAELVQSVSQSVDTVNAAIERFDQQIAYINEQVIDATVSAASGLADEVQPDPSSAQTQDEISSSEPTVLPAPQSQHDTPSGISGKFPELALPDFSRWWQGLSGWISGLVSVDRVSPEKSEAQ